MLTFLSLLAAVLVVTFTSPVSAQQPHEKIFDHFTCYKIKCVNKWGYYEECPKVRKKVALFNQFIDLKADYKWDDYPSHRDGEKALEVFVEAPELLCVPTHKDHARDGEYPDHEEPEPDPTPHGR
jgi:hypothetical protein